MLAEFFFFINRSSSSSFIFIFKNHLIFFSLTEPCVHDEISSEVQIISENNDLSMNCSSKASFTKNERVIKGESSKGQTTRDDICFAVKQGSSCLDKGRETGEYSELSSSLSCVADLLEMSCEDLNNENSISKGKLTKPWPPSLKEQCDFQPNSKLFVNSV